MKNYTKLILSIVVGALMVYTSCRKVDNAPKPSASTQSTATDTLGGQIAVNLVKSLAGTYGGVNIDDGVDSVSLANHNGPQHGYNAQALCGFFTDSLVNFNCKKGDTVSHTGGNLTFYFDCKDGKPTGYTAYDSLNTVRTIPNHTYQYTVKQYYTIKCFEDNHLFLGINGDIYFYDSTTTICGCHSTFTNIENANYVLKDLKVCLCDKDILSGTATFKAYGHNWSLTGTITFLGNHLADVLINGKVYRINVLTGELCHC